MDFQFFLPILRYIKRLKVMKRYTLKVYDRETDRTTNIQSLDEYHILMEIEDKMKEEDPTQEIWICDNLMEMLVG